MHLSRNFLITTLIIASLLTACSSTPAQPGSVEVDISPVATETVAVNVSTPVNQTPIGSSPNLDCVDIHPHPIAQGIAETYEAPYEQVVQWYCDGYSFDNIMIALETSEAVDIPPEALLEMLLEKEWEEIWDEVGFTRNE